MDIKIVTILSALSLALNPMTFAKATTSSQGITVKVEKVLLVDIDEGNTSTLKLIPKISQDKLQGWMIQNNQSTKILATSNTPTAKLYVKSDFAFSEQNLKLKVRLDNETNHKSYETELNNNNEVELGDIGMIVTGTNRSASPFKLSYFASKYGSSKVPAYDTYTATLTYTLRDN